MNRPHRSWQAVLGLFVALSVVLTGFPVQATGLGTIHRSLVSLRGARDLARGFSPTLVPCSLHWGQVWTSVSLAPGRAAPIKWMYIRM